MNDTRSYWKVLASLTISLVGTILFVVLGVKAIGFYMPFVIGWIISMIAAPIVNWLEKRFKIVRKIGTAIVVILVIAAIALIIYFAGSRLVSEVKELVVNIPQLYGQLEEGLSSIAGKLSGVFQRLPSKTQDGWNAALSNLDGYIGSWLSKISEPTMAAAGQIAKKVPYYLICLVIALLSGYFFTAQKEEVVEWLKKRSPAPVTKRMAMISDNLKYAVGGYFKAQFKIMGIVFLILAIGFALIKVQYFVLIALLVAFLDFLPFFGTGTVIFPWALYKVLVGNYKMAVLLLLIYVVTQGARQILQPKMVADSMGMNPILTLVLLYTGYKVSGVLGMILAVPIGLVVINMYRAGAFDYILDDVKILFKGMMQLRRQD